MEILQRLNKAYPVADDEQQRNLQDCLGATNKRIVGSAIEAMATGDMARLGELIAAYAQHVDRTTATSDASDAKAPAEPASDWTGSAEEWKQVIDEYRRPVDLGQIFNRKR